MGSFRGFLLKRLGMAVFLALMAVTIIFAMLRWAPGSPYQDLLLNPNLGPEQIQQIEARYGLDEPLYVQYINYVSALLTFDFGISPRTGRPVMDTLVPRILNSIVILVPALVVTAIVNTIAGFYIGWNRGSWLEKFSIIGTTTFRSIPVFVTGVFLLTIFAYWLELLPIFGIRSAGASYANWQQKYFSIDFLRHYLLPFTTAALFYSGDFMLLARNGVIEKKGAEFIKLHRAKGLSELEQLARAGRNSLLPIVTYFTLRMGMMFQGLVLLEIVFGWPGVGRELVIAINRSDYAFVQAAVFVMALAVIFGNLLSDVLYGYIDPTIKVGDRE